MTSLSVVDGRPRVYARCHSPACMLWLALDEIDPRRTEWYEYDPRCGYCDSDQIFFVLHLASVSYVVVCPRAEREVVDVDIMVIYD